MNEPTTAPGAAPAVPGYVTALWVMNLAWTVILLFATGMECLRGGQWTYNAPGSLIYFGTLAAYAGVKETHNWSLGAQAAEARGRKGILFVGIWVVFAMAAFLGVAFGKGMVYPHELSTITLEVLGIFFGTQASRALRKGRGRAGNRSVLEEGILKLVKETGGANVGQLAEKLQADKWDVQYAAAKLVKAGLLKKVSRGRRDPNTKYVAL